MKEDIEIKIVDSWPEEDIVGLYKSAGWWKPYYNIKGIPSLIEGSFAFVVVIDKKTGHAIGMGRVISDGVSDAYIQDLVILKKYRGKGLGKKLLQFLLDFCRSKKLLWVGLIAEPEQDGFYTNLGFKTMKRYIPMKFEKED